MKIGYEKPNSRFILWIRIGTVEYQEKNCALNLSKVRSQQVKQVADNDISGSNDFDEVSRYVQGYCFYPSPLGFLLLKLTNLCFQFNSSLNITVSIAIVFGIY